MAAVEAEENYALGYTDQERRRLMEQDRMLRRHTESLFSEAGLQAGMRVLDIGCGVGDVSLLAASVVGPGGTVVGVDRDGRSLQLARQRAADQGLANLTFVQDDVGTVTFDRPFDALVGRFILMYLPDPTATLRHLLNFVRPGGVVALQEYSISHDAVAVPQPVPFWDQLFQLATETFEVAGVNLRMGFELGQLFTVCGLGAPRMHMDVRLIGPSDPLGINVAIHTVRSLLPLAKRFGVDRAEEIDIETAAERLQIELASRNAAVSWPPIVGAWTKTEPARQ